MRTTTIVLLALLLAGGAPILAAPNSSEANGKVVDRSGEPIQGVKLTFSPKDNAALTYEAKTNKKGKYFVQGLFSSQGDRWNVTIEKEGLLPVEMTLETRTVNRVLVGDIRTVQIKARAKIPEVMIKPLGTARIDFVLAPAEEVEAAALAAQQAKAEASAVAEGGEARPAAPPKKDPWEEALGLASSGDREGALPFFDKAIEAEPNEAERREVYAKVLYQLKRLDAAAEQARRAIELAPGGVDARMVLYSVAIASGDLAGAKQALEQARAVAPRDLRVLQQTAFVASESGDVAGQVEAYEAVVEVAPDNAEAWLNLGGLYADQGDAQKSEQAYQKVIALDPTDAHQIFYNLGALTMNKPDRTDADTRRALDAFRKAVSYKPDYAQAYKQIAFALLNTGDRDGARGALENYVKYAPKAPDADQMRQLVKSLQK